MVGIGFKGSLQLKDNKLNLWDALTTLNHLQNYSSIYHGLEEDEEVVQFVACGKNEKLDADMNYSLN